MLFTIGKHFHKEVIKIMAFEMDVESDMGISFPSTYCYIHKIGGSKDLLYLQVNWYVDQAARFNNLKPIESRGYSFIPDVGEESLNFIKQGYIFLKTLEEFADTVNI
jgi:hypothetical protein